MCSRMWLQTQRALRVKPWRWDPSCSGTLEVLEIPGAGPAAGANGPGPRERPGIAEVAETQRWGFHPAIVCHRWQTWSYRLFALLGSFRPCVSQGFSSQSSCLDENLSLSVPLCIRNKYLGEVFLLAVCCLFLILERLTAKSFESFRRVSSFGLWTSSGTVTSVETP